MAASASAVGLSSVPLGAADGPTGDVEQPGQVKEQFVLLGAGDGADLFVQRQAGVRQLPSER
jgi:hypothetical protein